MINIVIVEDEAIIAENLKYTLEDFGFHVVSSCYSFDDAQKTLTEVDFDLALLDINLGPDSTKSGIVLSKVLQERNKPFIYLTAYNDKETIQNATKSKPVAYLIKPINPAMLFAAIQITLDNYLNDSSDINQEQPDFFYSKIGNKVTKVWWHQVGMMESTKNYVMVKTIEPRKEYLIRSSLTFVIQNMLPKSILQDFSRISRAIIIHNSQIVSFDTAGQISTTFGEFEGSKEHLSKLYK